MCDSLAITCVDEQDGVEMLTVGDVDSLDVLLCEDGDEDDIQRFAEALGCVLEDGSRLAQMACRAPRPGLGARRIRVSSLALALAAHRGLG
jgi:hypothetical protein